MWKLINKYDKIAHACIIAGVMQLSHIMNVIFVIILAVIISITKEICDIYKPNPTGFSWKDLLADFIGLIIGLII